MGFVCEECGKVLKTERNLKCHKKNIHDVNIVYFTCEKCDFKTKYKSNLTRHIKRVHGVNVIWYMCPKCDYKTKYKNNLTNHIKRIHSVDEIWYMCPKCDHKSKIKNDLTRHIKHMHSVDVIWYMCPKCDHKTKNKGNLNQHLSAIHNIGKEQCEFCFRNVPKVTLYIDVQGRHNICPKCFKKVTGRNSRIEFKMSDYLDKHFGTEYLIGSDQRIYGEACQLYRPDKIYSSPNLVLHIECDEFQHKGRYDYSCEEKRISDIYNEFPGKQYIVIRWNPHTYTYPELTKKLKIKNRLKLLLQLMNKITKIHIPYQIYIVYMFYDIDNDNIAQNIPFTHIHTNTDVEELDFS